MAHSTEQQYPFLDFLYWFSFLLFGPSVLYSQIKFHTYHMILAWICFVWRIVMVRAKISPINFLLLKLLIICKDLISSNFLKLKLSFPLWDFRFSILYLFSLFYFTAFYIDTTMIFQLLSCRQELLHKYYLLTILSVGERFVMHLTCIEVSINNLDNFNTLLPIVEWSQCWKIACQAFSFCVT